MIIRFIIIFSLFGVIFVLLPILGAVCFVSRKYRISEDEAMDVVKEKCLIFLKKVAPFLKMIAISFYKLVLKLIKEFTNTAVITTYPLYFGYNGAQFVLPCIDETFSEICKEFGACYCSVASFANDCSFVTYSFAIQRKPNPLPDEDLEPLLQKKAEKIVMKQLNLAGITAIAEPLTLAELQQEFLFITCALNTAGIQKLNERKGIIRNSRIKEKIKNVQAPFTESWGKKQGGFGYLKTSYDENGIALPIDLPIEKYVHALLVGSSGSGKSMSLVFILGKLLQVWEDSIEVFICDFKKSEEFDFLQGYPNYYAGNNCYDGIMAYYEKFLKVREKGRNDGKRCLLIVDEYPAFINHLQMQDKLNKTKRAADILNAVAEILMLGRRIGSGSGSTSFGVYIVCQRADASLFANGARDNFMIVCGLGRMSREQKGMLFAGEDLPENTIYSAGEGLLLADGRELIEVKFPLIEDLQDWKQHILDILDRSWEIEL